MATKYTTVSIPEPLSKRIKDAIKGTGFTSASDFVTFVLREVLSSPKASLKDNKTRKVVIEKLKRLGYIK